jgi:glycosyltransferase involved in cell wall biosynthesis
MKILIICTIYAPDRSPRAYRWTALAEHWAAAGHHVEVIAGWKPGDPRREPRNGVIVHRVGSFVERLRAALGRGSHRVAVAQEGVPSMPPEPGKLERAAKAIYNATLRQLFWPDYAFHWYPSAVRKARALLASGAFDAAISVSHPFTPHLVGLALKRAHPTLRWIVDIGDPFSLLDEIPLNNRALYKGLNRRAEAAVLRRADAVAVTVERCRADYAASFPESAAKIAVIPPLLSLPESTQAGTSYFSGGAIHLVSIGTFYRALRHPGFLLALLAALRQRRVDLHLHIFGTLNDCAACFEPYRAEIGRNIHFHGMVPRETIAAVMRSADILVNIGNSTAHQLPSKLVEYAAAARPILNLATRPGDSAAAFLAGYPSSLTLYAADPPDEASVTAALAFIAKPPPIDQDAARHFLSPYTIERVSEAYDRLIGPTGDAAQPQRMRNAG